MFHAKEDVTVLLVFGGDKSSQQRDIRKAQEILAQLKENKLW
ncbi:hypothetical protein ACFQY8_01065 [Alloscardovia venturai]|uniref:Addiction module killer protein n=1 Tax=Alloscardovia venturai TaxID=1769421 RepID=A0ABW2Y4E6_9BIFI